MYAFAFYSVNGAQCATRLFLPLCLLALGCSGTPADGNDTHVPQLGRYQFDATVAGAAYGGTLTISAASTTSATYHMVMVSGTTEDGTATYSEGNGWLFGAHANNWTFLPHMTRHGSTYECSGVAVLPSTPMLCTWTYLGP